MSGVYEISAGGLVYRNIGNELHIQLIEDRFGKITLPKGKMEQGETLQQTALREILEETGMAGEIVQNISVVRYQYAKSATEVVEKEVHYYLVKAESGISQAQLSEIRGVKWFAPQDAWRNQVNSGYANNTSVVKRGLELLGIKVDL